jgi:hypothetical protein
MLKVCSQSVHHHTFQINQPTGCNDFSSLLLDVYVQLNTFLGIYPPIIGSSTTAVAGFGFTVESWW